MQKTRKDKGMSRRTILKSGAAALIMAGPAFLKPSLSRAAFPGRTAVLYFSHSGNTARVAQAIHAALGGGLIEVRTTRQYSRDYDTVVDEAKREQQANARPALATAVPDLSGYETVFIGYPNWGGTMPMCLFTLLEDHAKELSGRTIVPFCTHEGSGLGRGPADIRKLVPGAVVKAGFDMRGRSSGSAGERVGTWLKKNGYFG